MDRREPGGEAQAALQLRLQLGQREVRAPRDQPPEVRFMRRQQRPAMAAKARGAALPVVRTRCISLITADGSVMTKSTHKALPAPSLYDLPPSDDEYCVGIYSPHAEPLFVNIVEVSFAADIPWEPAFPRRPAGFKQIQPSKQGFSMTGDNVFLVLQDCVVKQVAV